MATPQLSTTDEVVAQVVTKLTTEQDRMTHASGVVNAVKSDILPAAFQGTAAQAFEARMDDWLAAYQRVNEKLKIILVTFGHAQHGILEANQQATQLGGSAFGPL